MKLSPTQMRMLRFIAGEIPLPDDRPCNRSRAGMALERAGLIESHCEGAYRKTAITAAGRALLVGLAAPTYSARWEETGAVVYAGQPRGNLVGLLPIGACAAPDSGTLVRQDGGDPFERARFVCPSGRVVVVSRDGTEARS